MGVDFISCNKNVEKTNVCVYLNLSHFRCFILLHRHWIQWKTLFIFWHDTTSNHYFENGWLIILIIPIAYEFNNLNACYEINFGLKTLLRNYNQSYLELIRCFEMDLLVKNDTIWECELQYKENDKRIFKIVSISKLTR